MARELTQDIGITMLHNMNYMALHAKRQTVSPKDLKIAMQAAMTMNFYKLLRNM
jgi:histone H3/H4